MSRIKNENREVGKNGRKRKDEKLRYEGEMRDGHVREKRQMMRASEEEKKIRPEGKTKH